jgi:hypothetical protein
MLLESQMVLRIISSVWVSRRIPEWKEIYENDTYAIMDFNLFCRPKRLKEILSRFIGNYICEAGWLKNIILANHAME